MRRWWLVLVFACILGKVVTQGVNRKPAGVAAQGDAPALRDFVCAECGYRVKMPGTPQRSIEYMDGYDVIMHAVSGRDVGFRVQSAERKQPFAGEGDAAGLEKMLELWKQSILERGKRTLIKQNRIALQGQHLGLELETKGPDDEIVRYRLFLVGKQSYCLRVWGKPDIVYTPMAEEFFASFELLPP